MSNKKKETKVLCPQCGTEFVTSKNEFTTAVAVPDAPAKLSKTAQERIDALRNAGVD